MRQGVRQVCPVKKALGFFSRRQRAMPFAVRFVRRRRTQQKKQRLAAGRCANLRRKIARRSYFALPRCARDKEETGTILSLAWQKRRFARSGLSSEACKPARLRRPAQVCRSDRAQNGVAFGNNTTPACRQDGMTCARLPWQNGDNTRRAVFARLLFGGDIFFVIMPDASPLLLGRHLLFVLYSLQKYARVWCGRRGSFCLRFGLRLTIMRPLWYGEGRRRRSERNCDDTRRLRLLLCLPPTCGYGYTCASSRCAAATL